ncbi:MAG: hypothetical protein JO061_18715 [Acidobacteriaceae bacterium]|nr:hypothetical protein [Acidobacteriaceae bacterium]
MRLIVWVCLVALPAVLNAQQTEDKTPIQPGQIGQTVHAPPFTVADKFDYRVVQTFGARGFIGSALGAAIGQANDTPSEWGQGFGGLAKRYVSGFAGNCTRQIMAFAIEAPLHEDPRYFPSEDKSMKERFWNAIKQVYLTRKDDGGQGFAYGRVISDFANGQLVNAWQPRSTGAVSNGIERGFISLGADAGYDLLQEFVPFTRPISLRHRH